MTGKLEGAYRHMHEADRLKRGVDVVVAEPTTNLDQPAASSREPLHTFTTRETELRRSSDEIALRGIDKQKVPSGESVTAVGGRFRAGTEQGLSTITSWSGKNTPHHEFPGEMR